MTWRKWPESLAEEGTRVAQQCAQARKLIGWDRMTFIPSKQRPFSPNEDKKQRELRRVA